MREFTEDLKAFPAVKGRRRKRLCRWHQFDGRILMKDWRIENECGGNN